MLRNEYSSKPETNADKSRSRDSLNGRTSSPLSTSTMDSSRSTPTTPSTPSSTPTTTSSTGVTSLNVNTMTTITTATTTTTTPTTTSARSASASPASRAGQPNQSPSETSASNTGNNNNNNNNNSNNNNNNSALGAMSAPTGRQVPKRRMRRRATSQSQDPAEQLTEMSVRGLNLFRYASISEGVYQCTECAKLDIQKTFKNKYSFQRHAFLYHEGHQRKVFPCPVCGKEFSRPDKMKNHMKTVHDCFMPKDCVVPFGFFLPP
ncbi:hypothetical protein KQX54_013395 [Cotesia glomerata]|uniref:C2H2-type domain-containing protein n=1 Tax=Cotesia glomerata TaxID=32391 RepID=A0AAV7J360_COTGL|nr:hypothetical protein KQX54_013395 [Cotesia glomerata]